MHEALARQRATSEILCAIAHSPADLRPVFEAIVARGRPMRLQGSAWCRGSKRGSCILLAMYKPAPSLDRSTFDAHRAPIIEISRGEGATRAKGGVPNGCRDVAT